MRSASRRVRAHLAGFRGMCAAHRACYNDEMAGGLGGRTRSASRLLVIGMAALAVLLLVAAAGTGLQFGVADGVADASDVAGRAIVGGLAGAAVGGAALLALRWAGVAAALALTGAAAALLVVVTVAALGATAAVSTAPLNPQVATVEPVQSAGRAGGASEAPAVDEDRSGGTLPDWVQTVMMVIAVVAMLLVVVGAGRSAPAAELLRRHAFGQAVRRDAEPVVEDVDDDIDAEAAADVFEDAASIGEGLDPRRHHRRLRPVADRTRLHRLCPPSARGPGGAPASQSRDPPSGRRAHAARRRQVSRRPVQHPSAHVRRCRRPRAGLRAVGAQLRDLAVVAPA